MRVLYDDDAIYFGFDCDQVNTPIVETADPARSRLGERVGLDPTSIRATRARAPIMFAVNISGTIADGQIIDQTTYSWEWDENWEAKRAHRRRRLVRRDPHPDPRAALRRQPARPELGLAGRALHRRSARRRICGPTSRATSRRRSRTSGASTTCAGSRAAARWSCCRSASATRAGATRRDTMLGSGFKLVGSAGLNLKWHLANDVTLDAAFNPDFAQVEADQVILNLTNFETFLPEKRPFFLEGIDAFSLPAAGVLLAPHRRGADWRRRWGRTELLADVPLARHDLRRRQGGRAPGPGLDASARSARSPRANRVTIVPTGHVDRAAHRGSRRRRPRSTCCASSASSATPATSASSARASTTLDDCERISRRVPGRRRRPLAFAVGRIRDQRRPRPVVHPRRRRINPRRCAQPRRCSRTER